MINILGQSLFTLGRRAPDWLHQACACYHSDCKIFVTLLTKKIKGGEIKRMIKGCLL